MSYTMNELRIEMKNAYIAEIAADAVRNYVNNNSSTYESMAPSTLMQDLSIDGNAVVLNGSFSMRGWDYMVFVPEICKAIATLNAVESFIGTASCESGYNDFGSVQMNYENSTLHIKSVYFPEGDEFLCPEDGCFVCRYEDLTENGTYICEECGEEFSAEDLIGEMPEIMENTFEIK